MNAAFQSNLVLSLSHFASAVGLPLEAVRRAGERGDLVIDEYGQVDLWERENWSYLMRAVNNKRIGGSNDMQNENDKPAENLKYGKDQWGKKKQYASGQMSKKDQMSKSGQMTKAQPDAEEGQS